MKTALIPDGKISRAIREGLDLRGKLLADGMAEEEADRIVGQGLKAAWQDSTGESTRAWFYYCDRCKDTGWIEVEPNWPRLRRLYGADAPRIPDFRKCDPCRWQNRQREIAMQQKSSRA